MAGTLMRYQVQIQHLKGLLEAEQRLRHVAETRATEARAALVELAEAFCGRDLDAINRENKGAIDGWPPEKLRDFITSHLAARLNRLQAGERVGELYEATQKRLSQLAQNLAAEYSARTKAEAQIEELEVALRTAQQALADANRRLANPQDVEGGESFSREPSALIAVELGDWFADWRSSSSFERDQRLVQLLGLTGLSLRPKLLGRLAEEWAIDPSSGSLRRLLERLQERQLIDVLKPKSDHRGRAPHLIRLTARGAQAFQALFGQKSKPSQLDDLLARHKSLEHALLNLEASELLAERLSAAVDLYPAPITLDERGRQFAPDLAATLPEGDTFYVECERDTGKNREARQRKWQNVYDATGGRLFIVCPDKNARSRIVSEINQWAGMRKLTLNATDVSTLRQRTDKFWFYSRQRNGR